MNKIYKCILTMVPYATVFLANACVMILEIIATRLIARHLGASLYTWTSVICVILTGITLGNDTGGRIADISKSKNVIGLLFITASFSCVGTIILNNVLGNLNWLKQMNLPTHIFVHTSLVFIVPSFILGMISPVVAKLAIDQGKSTGRTIGSIYAYSAAGSIVGTFLAGFYRVISASLKKMKFISKFDESEGV